MNILINNKPELTEAKNISELVANLHLPEKGVAIAMDNRMIPRTEWDTTPLHSDANIVIIKAACGG